LEDVPPLVVLTPTSLEVAGLSVAYGETEVLSKVDMSIPIPGMVGIVGESGAGKSTLVHALIGLVSPVRGSIRIGPHDLATSALAAWRGTIGYVPQETILFNASVRDNLIFGRPKITEEELATVARQALAHDFIMSLPAGYDTPIGDRGVLLSGGQRQRLGIARALLLRPLILMMDEPTSSLDSSSEAELLKTIDELRKTIGVIIVAHRLASVRTADRIYVLDRGRLAESGHWDDLMGARTRLHALAQAQQLVI
jgi:subfamily B ATP-binding cassette protein MsbA